MEIEMDLDEKSKNGFLQKMIWIWIVVGISNIIDKHWYKLCVERERKLKNINSGMPESSTNLPYMATALEREIQFLKTKNLKTNKIMTTFSYNVLYTLKAITINNLNLGLAKMKNMILCPIIQSYFCIHLVVSFLNQDKRESQAFSKKNSFSKASLIKIYNTFFSSQKQLTDLNIRAG